MANLGSIGVDTGTLTLNVVDPIVFFKTSTTLESINVAEPLETTISLSSAVYDVEVFGTTSKDVKGITRQDGIPSQKLLRLYNRRTGQLVKESLSNPDGSFSFDDLAYSETFYVVILDQNNVYHAEVADYL